MDRILLQRKCAHIEEYLTELTPYLMRETSVIVHDTPTLHIIERLMQLIVDTAVDINSHIIKTERLRSPDDFYNTFIVIAEKGVIDYVFAEKIAISVGLRNRIVYNYESVSKTQMVEDIKVNIQDYTTYLKAILVYVESRQEKEV